MLQQTTAPGNLAAITVADLSCNTSWYVKMAPDPVSRQRQALTYADQAYQDASRWHANFRVPRVYLWRVHAVFKAVGKPENVWHRLPLRKYGVWCILEAQVW